MATTFEWGWTLTTIIFFSIGAYFDIKDRLIPDKVWAFQLGIGAIVTYLWVMSDPGLNLILVALSNLAFSVLIGIIAFLTGSLSGADMKAIIVLSVSSPVTFTLTDAFLNLNILFPPIIHFLLNVLLFMLFFIFYNIIRNLLSIAEFGPLFDDTKGTINQKISVMISSWRIRVEKVEDLRHMDPAERYFDGEWELYTPLFQEILDDEEFAKLEKSEREEAIRGIGESGRKWIWARPQPPGILFFLLAYLILVLVGSPFGFIFFFLS